MAGVEIAGLAVGVLPVIVLTAEAYRTTYDKIRSFRDWSSELLLRLVIHDDRSRTMLEDLDDKLWKDQELNDLMHKC
ncbi:hypothetical protein H2201_005592 [Coniosporium apollinis]|uniref:Prion-inhibition and propagation HeLo domain-containing protein n=1 Tax=Coniosporium apollinis TaxID=61459 RepID=A0ABQ9NRN9_9PEZI|nr:hypothetical protein H2201_005592 [Coniosporium apollinis]